MHVTRLVRSLIPAAATSALALAQCEMQPHGEGPFAGADGDVTGFVEWDPDGPGPLGTHLVVCGDYQHAVAAGGLALYDPASDSWSSLGQVDGRVFDAAVSANNELIIGGRFTSIDGVAAMHVARFDGSSWQPIGVGIDDPDGRVLTVAVHPNGDLYCGGRFQYLIGGSAQATSIARWDGSQWVSIGNLVVAIDAQVRDLAILPNGDVVATGFFAAAGGTPAASIARWDGASWQPLGSGLLGNTFLPIGLGRQLHVEPNGDLIVAGNFNDAGGVPVDGLAFYDGSSWSAPTVPLAGIKRCLLRAANGDLIVGGSLQPNQFLRTPASRWNGSAWVPQGFGAELGETFALHELPGGDLLAGTEALAPGAAMRGLRRWNGLAWQPLADGVDGDTGVALALDTDETLVIGAFRRFAGVPTNNGALRTGGAWVPKNLGVFSEWSGGNAIELDGGHVVMSFRSDPFEQLFVAYANGLVPQFVGSPVGEIHAFAKQAPNSVVLGGEFSVLQGQNLLSFDIFAQTYTPVDPQFTGTITAMSNLPDGRVLFGGDLAAGGVTIGHLATFDNGVWNVFGGDLDAAPRDLEVLPNGDVVALGDITVAGGTPVSGIARFDGNSWHPLGVGFPVGNVLQRPLDMAVTAAGDLVVGGTFTVAGATPARNIARWDGATWNAIGAGADGTVRTVDGNRHGTVVCTGDFQHFDGEPATFFARIEPTCPAPFFQFAAGFCSQPVLQLQDGAWLGSTLRTSGTYFQPGPLTLAAYGFAPTGVDLSSIFGAGLPGCFLVVDPAFITLAPQVGGTARAELPIPNNPLLAGQSLYHQLLGIGIGGQGQLTSVSASNGVAFTIGSHW